MRTTDGGVTWTRQISETPAHLYGVSFTNASTGTAVGLGGTILRTTNSGTTWRPQSNNPRHLYSFSFTDINSGTAVGDRGTILRTTNAGEDWIVQTSGTQNTLLSASFTSAATGTVVGAVGTILHTTNGGATWTNQVSGTTLTLFGVSFTDANIGTAVGETGTIVRTTTGGAVSVEDNDGFTGTRRSSILDQNYPNPTDASTTFRFHILSSGFVTLDIIDDVSNTVSVVVNQSMHPGIYSVTFDTKGLPSGVYTYRLRNGGAVASGQMVVVR